MQATKCYNIFFRSEQYFNKITGENHVLVFEKLFKILFKYISFSFCSKMEFDRDLLTKCFILVEVFFLIQLKKMDKRYFLWLIENK